MIDSQKAIALGAQPFFLTGGPLGVLIVHGYGGSIGDYRSYADQLHHRGYTVSGLRVAGHGQGVEVLAKSDIYDWRQSVFSAAAVLRQQCQKIFLVGASFGGALAIDYAAHAEKGVTGMVLVNTPLAYRRAKIRKMGLSILRLFRSDLPKFGLSSSERARYAQLGSTTSWPISGLLETERFLNLFATPALPRIEVPVLIMKNAGDPYVSEHSAQTMLGALPNTDKRLVEIPGRTHRPFRDPAAVTFMADQTDAFIQSVLAKK